MSCQMGLLSNFVFKEQFSYHFLKSSHGYITLLAWFHPIYLIKGVIAHLQDDFEKLVRLIVSDN